MKRREEKAQPKEEHPSSPLQGREVYGCCEKCEEIYELETGHRCILPFFTERGGGQSNRALIALMKAVEAEITVLQSGLPVSEGARAPRSNPSIITQEYR